MFNSLCVVFARQYACICKNVYSCNVLCICVQESVPAFTKCVARSVLCIFDRDSVPVFAKYVASSVLCICKIL